MKKLVTYELADADEKAYDEDAMKRRQTLLLTISSVLVLIIVASAVLVFWKIRHPAPETPSQNSVTNNTENTVNNVVANVVNNSTNTSNATNNTTNTPTNTTPAPTPTPKPIPTPTVWTEISRGNTSKKQVIFTFDGGSGNQSAQKILDVLARHHVKGTFFLTGKFAQANPSYTKKFADAGHEIFNHTYDHPDLTKVSDAKIQDELNQAEDTISGITGKTTKPYFRPPYGARNQHVRDVAKSLGYRSVFWTVDALDWKESEGETASQVKTKILSNVTPGTIYLMHIGDNITGQVLDEVFTEIESRGYKIVPLSEGI